MAFACYVTDIDMLHIMFHVFPDSGQVWTPLACHTTSVCKDALYHVSCFCRSWAKAHPSTLPEFLSFFTPIARIFSSGGGSSSIEAITSIFGSKITLHQGLTQSGTDGYSALLRQGSAAILNSYTVRDFPYRPVEVKSAFRGALVSQQAAFVMATKFENANLSYGARH